jgi:hypothetical protein
MAGPFFNNVKSVASGTPGTGAFVVGATVLGAQGWAIVAPGWIGLVRYDDGSAAEESYGYWNGTQITRPANGFVWSTTSSQLSLSSSATATLVTDGAEAQPHVGTVPWRGGSTMYGSASSIIGGLAITVAGTGAAVSLATTNFLTQQPRIQYTSLTTANAQGGWSATTAQLLYSTTAGAGGGEYVMRFGASQLPTGPRLFMGLTTVTFVGSTGEPSALAASIIGFTKDSTDTNIQFLTKDGTTAHKIDTGIPLAANGWYEASVWFDPGGGKAYGLLVRLDTGDIWYGTTTSNLPANGSLFFPMMIGGLSSTTGTAMIIHMGSLWLRNGT